MRASNQRVEALVCLGDHTRVAVEAYRVVDLPPEAGDLQLAVHRGPQGWLVTELSTGRYITSYLSQPEAALRCEAVRRVEQYLGGTNSEGRLRWELLREHVGKLTS